MCACVSGFDHIDDTTWISYCGITKLTLPYLIRKDVPTMSTSFLLHFAVFTAGSGRVVENVAARERQKKLEPVGLLLGCHDISKMRFVLQYGILHWIKQEIIKQFPFPVGPLLSGCAFIRLTSSLMLAKVSTRVFNQSWLNSLTVSVHKMFSTFVSAFLALSWVIKRSSPSLETKSCTVFF